MSNPSATAGKACAECGMPDTCVLDVITDFPKNKEKHIWSREGRVHFDLLDKGQGCAGIIVITFKCSKSSSHEAWLEEISGNTRIPLSIDGSPNNVILSYKGQNNNMAMADIFRSPWEYLSCITTPLYLFDAPAHYTIEIDGCYDCGTYTAIDVYPLVEIRFTTGLSYEIISSKRERTVKERRDEQIQSRETMNDTKPKNRNKLRDGWTNSTAQFEWSNKKSLTVEFGVKVGNVEYSHKYEEEIKKLRTIKTLEQLRRIDTLLNNINKYFAPDPEKDGNTRQYAVFSAKIEPAKLGISYAYQYIDLKDGPCHFYGLVGKPFLEAKIKFDIIQFICAYCKIDSLIAKCRAYLKKHGTSVECYIEISSGVNINLGAVYATKDKLWEFNIPKKNQLYVGLKGVVSATFEAEVFVVTLKAYTKASIGAVAGFEFDQHDDGLDLAMYHDGIKGSFEFMIDASYDEEDSKTNNTQKNENKVKKEWLLCAPLKASDSSLRVNLYGKPRSITKSTVTPPNPGIPWAMGSNPDWDKRNDIGYNGTSYP